MKTNKLQKLFLATALSFGTFTTMTPYIMTPIYAEETTPDYMGEVVLKKSQFTYDGTAKSAIVESVKAYKLDDPEQKTTEYKAVDQLTQEDKEGYYLIVDNGTKIDTQVNAGNYTKTVTGKLVKHAWNEDTNEYEDTVLGTYESAVEWLINQQDQPVGKLSIGSSDVSLTNSLTYNGQQQTQTISVKVGNQTLTEGCDFTVSGNKATDAGTYTLTVSGMGQYTGTVTKQYTIAQQTKKTVANATVTLVSPLTYTGKEQTQKITVNVGGVTLTEGCDYTVSGNTATKAGTYKLTVTGKGNYEGTITKEYTIAAKKETDVSKATVTLSNTLVYNGQEQTQKVEVKLGNTTLTEGTDYIVTGNTATEIGNYTLTITGKGDYEGTITKEYSVNEVGSIDTVPYILGGTTAGCGLAVGIGAVIYSKKKIKK